MTLLLAREKKKTEKEVIQTRGCFPETLGDLTKALITKKIYPQIMLGTVSGGSKTPDDHLPTLASHGE